MPLSVGGGLRSKNDFQSIMKIFLWEDRSLIKLSRGYDQELSSV